MLRSPTGVAWRRVSVAVAVVVSGALSLVARGVGGVADATAAAGLAPFGAGRPGAHFLGYYHGDGNAGSTAVSEARRRRLVVLNAWEHTYIPQIKAANPGTLVLVYKDLSSARDHLCSDDNNSLPTGVDYCYADRTHPEWFLTDSAGRRLRYDAYPDHWQMDVGNASYQQAWLAAVRPTLSARGWDGVFLDNALTSADDYHPGVFPAAYPSHGAFQSAYRAMLGTAAAGLRAAGFFTVGNINNARAYSGLWGGYLTHLDGAYEEWFVDWSATAGGSASGAAWKAQVDQIAETATAGKLALVRAGNTPVAQDPDGFRYALGSYLLASDGRALFGFGFDLGYEPQYDWDLGAAVGPYSPAGNGAYRRDFTAGTVIVNAAPSSAVTVSLGKEYQDENGNRVTSVTVPPQRAAILRAPAASPKPPPPARATPPPTVRAASPTTRTTRAVVPARPTVTSAAPPTGVPEAPASATGVAEPAVPPPLLILPGAPEQPPPDPSEVGLARRPTGDGRSALPWLLTGLFAGVPIAGVAVMRRRHRNGGALDPPP